MEIKHRYTGAVLYSAEATSMRELVELAVRGGANLIEADFEGANLAGTNFTGSNFRRANLTGANFRRANLTWTNFTLANLTWTNLTGANLTWTNFTLANLTGANFTLANLTGANLTGANFTLANLTGANLRGANFRRTSLNWQSHDLMAHLLFAAADDMAKRMVAGLILVSRDWCWEDFVSRLSETDKAWAFGVLAEYVKEDQTLPEEMVAYMEARKEVEG